MGWRYKAGLVLIGSVVLIWVTSAEVTQSIFDKYRHPFALTYLGASLLTVYLPIALLKDRISGCFRKSWTVQRRDSSIDLEAYTTSLPNSPVKSNGLHRLQGDEVQPFVLLKDGTFEMAKDEEGCNLILKTMEDCRKTPAKVTSWELMRLGFCLAPLWFFTEYLSNAALAHTSVASTTILSSTAGLFTLMFSILLGQDKFDIVKAIAVLVSITGVAMTTLGKTWATDDGQVSLEADGHSILGDVLGLLSAVSYGVFTVLLKKHAGEEGGSVDMQKLFGYIGLFTLFCLWWLVFPLHFLGLEPTFSIPTTAKLDEVLLANGFLGSVVSDYFWALSVVWTTPLVATLGMSLTIPLAMLADVAVHGRHYSAIYVLGSIQVFAGFVIANLTNRCSREMGL
eukprot:TRINITY_DN13308_c0_g1_i1.p1 TRINITY_DN13308_c0_g1~~TRINITY_DN13308_c0_g1_i1.p1  ORF type:complete len:396 (-),score=54.91 TRINITY_DN13308_c0_g1_i1:707-1894(-)